VTILVTARGIHFGLHSTNIEKSQEKLASSASQYLDSKNWRAAIKAMYAKKKKRERERKREKAKRGKRARKRKRRQNPIHLTSLH
jgi:hypothetical protein